jgi:hypothetical protein
VNAAQIIPAVAVAVNKAAISDERAADPEWRHYLAIVGGLILWPGWR